MAKAKQLSLLVASIMVATSAQAETFDDVVINNTLAINAGSSANPSQPALQVHGTTVDGIAVADPYAPDLDYENDSITSFNSGFISSQGGYSHLPKLTKRRELATK